MKPENRTYKVKYKVCNDGKDIILTYADGSWLRYGINITLSYDSQLSRGKTAADGMPKYTIAGKILCNEQARKELAKVCFDMASKEIAKHYLEEL